MQPRLSAHAVARTASDAKCFAGAPLFWGDAERSAYCETAVIPGHEFVGTIAARGTDAPAWAAVGQRVVAEQIVPCRACRYCVRGDYHVCEPHHIFGFKHATPGSWAQFMLLGAKSLVHPVPASVPAKAAVFAEPLACAVHGVQRGDLQFADVVVVSGCGSIGLGMLAAARRKNPRLLIAVDLLPRKLAVARACGADVTLNPSECDVVAEIKRLSDGYGCDVYLEAAGATPSVKQGLHAIAKMGRFVEFSVFGSECSVDWTIIGDTKSLDIRGAHLSPKTFPVALKMLEEKALPMNDIITHELPLSEFRKGIDLVNNVSGEHSIKVVLNPWEGDDPQK